MSMRRRSVITGLIVEAPHVIHKTVGMLSNLERGAAMWAVGTAARRVASQRMRVASSRQEFVIFPSRFFNENNSAMMSENQE